MTPANSPSGKDSSSATPSPSPKAEKRTWGEKIFDRGVYGVAGYGVNLVLSALVSYAVLENKHGANIAKLLREKFYKKTLRIDNESLVKTLTNAFTLLMGGHIVALLMIKPAEDHKSEIVRWLDKKHYGENAELDPAIKQAHERIDHEAKPTYLGIMTARMISWLMVQAAAYTVGNKENIINKFGEKQNIDTLKKFKGIELHSKEMGTLVADLTPNAVHSGFNRLYRPLVNPEASVEHGLTSSGKSPLLSERRNSVYKEVLEYTFMDIFYTAITAITIKPVNKFLMKHVSLFRHSTADGPTNEIPPVKTAYFLDKTNMPEAMRQENKKEHVVSAVAHDGVLAQPQLQKA